MVAVSVKTPYSTAMPFVQVLDTNIPTEYDRQRVASYDVYDDMYDNDPDTMKKLLRSDSEQPVYVPTARRIINTLGRYVGRGWGFVVDPDSGSETDQDAAKAAFGALFKRERILAKFSYGKKEFLRRGDWLWYVSADPDKLPGSRIRIDNIDPRTYFPITDSTNPNKITGQQIVEQQLNEDEEIVVKVQRWLKPSNPKHPAFGSADADIVYESLVYALEGFGDPEEETVLQTLTPMVVLTGIKQLPIYHIKNNEESDNPFGRSDLSGLESIIQDVNQSISDESEALAMAGLGMYYTDSGAPVDEDGEETDWVLGAKQVIEVGDGRKFERVSGLTSVEPTQTHVTKIEESAYGSNGITNIALGAQGANIQESGVALALRMSPLFDTASEKDITINDVLSQMLFDLVNYWFPAYEQMSFPEVVVSSTISVADRLPFDRDSRFKELTALHAAGILPLEYVLDVLESKFDYEFPDDILQKALDEQDRLAKAAVPQDIFDTRAAAETAE